MCIRDRPSCTDELLEKLGHIQKQQHLPVQSHLSENRGEVAVSYTHLDVYKRQLWMC